MIGTHCSSKMSLTLMRGIWLVLLSVALGISAKGQNTDGTTPAGVAPGAPAGSYPLSDFDSINLFNGNLNFSLPLVKIGGRGNAGHVIPLTLENKWRTIQYGSYPIHYALDQWWDFSVGYSKGKLAGRIANFPEMGCEYDVGGQYQTLLRLTFSLPDGTEYELHSALNSTVGVSEYSQWCAINQTPNRGKVFVTRDGSAATFVSDVDLVDLKEPNLEAFNPSGYLLMKDGTRYRIDSGKITWVRDANGNQVTFSYSADNVSQITDSLGRTVTFSYRDYYMSVPDQITYQGFGGSSRTVRIYYSSLQPALRSDQALKTVHQLFPELTGVNNSTYNPAVVSYAELPDGRRYYFKYNSYGELARVDLPTGGAFEYDWEGGVSGGTLSGVMAYRDIYRRVIKRRVYADGGSGSSFTSEMTIGKLSGGSLDVENKNSAGTRLSKTRHYFYGTPTISISNRDPLYQNPPEDGKEWKTEAFDLNGTTILRREEHSWAWTPYPQITQTTTTLVDSNLVSKQTFAYDAYGNQTDSREYGFGVGASPTHPTRHTQRTFITTNPANSIDYASPNPTATSVHIRNLQASQKIYAVNPSNGVETLAAESEIAYDESAYPIMTYGPVVGWTDPGTPARGGATTVRAKLLSTGAWLATHTRYDQLGNPRKSWDARGSISEVEYAGNHYAYPTQTTSAVPDTTGQFGSNAPFITTSVYDFWSGLVTSSTDANYKTTSYTYEYPLDRLKTVSFADGGQTTFNYDDTVSNLRVETVRKKTASENLYTYQYFDKLGRANRTFVYVGSGKYTTADTQFDALGRVWRVSNPYESTGAGSAINPTGNWTTNAYDALGRTVSVTTPDNAQVITVYGASTSGGLGTTVTVTDQAGKQRKSVTDALGRLVQVYEAPAGLNFLTSYSYDALDNLLTVDQGGQVRTFVYDSLKRLSSAANPESGTITYTYDNNGNLLTKTDARGVVCTYAYDALNRNTTVNYSDTTGINPDLTRIYDGAINGKGRFWYNYAGGNYSIGATVEHTAIDSYDTLGRPTIQRQVFKQNSVWGPTYQISRSYNFAGGVSLQTYPSTRTVSYTYDDAGRTASFTGNLGDNVNRTYATGIKYSDWGGLSHEEFGTDIALYHKQNYTNRGQLFDMRVSTLNDGSWNRGAIVNYYSLSNWGFGNTGTDTNGNLYGQQHWVPHNDQTYTVHQQNYSYDSLNRISWVGEYLNGGTPTGAQQYSYDRWGNRKIDPATWGTGINNKQFDVNTANNRLGVPGGQSGTMSYDAAGNLSNDTYSGGGNRVYDAENRMISAQGINQGAWQYYNYNADGLRVRRNVNIAETWQIYGMDGELLAEYAANAAATNPQKEYGYRNGQLLVTAEAATNVALTSSGATTSASSTLVNPPFSYPVSAVSNGDRKGLNGGYGGNWAGSSASFPQWVQVEFNACQTISEIHVFSLQDNYANPLEPTEAMTFSLYGLTGFDVQYWNGSAWVTVPGGSVSGNNKVWKKISFAAITTTKIRVLVNATVDGWSRIVEVEAWTSASATINWLVADHLGTPRMIFDKTGSLANVKRHDYLPFGEELFAGAGGRTSGNGYCGDAIRQKFTNYERDNETSLDFAQARYHASVQGRFTSVDPLHSSATVDNPQTFNRYTYALNTPQTLTDPSGMLPIDQAPGGWGPGKESNLIGGAGGALNGGNFSLYVYDVIVEAFIGDPIVELAQTPAVVSQNPQPLSDEQKDILGLTGHGAGNRIALRPACRKYVTGGRKVNALRLLSQAVKSMSFDPGLDPAFSAETDPGIGGKIRLGRSFFNLTLRDNSIVDEFQQLLGMDVSGELSRAVDQRVFIMLHEFKHSATGKEHKSIGEYKQWLRGLYDNCFRPK